MKKLFTVAFLLFALGFSYAQDDLVNKVKGQGSDNAEKLFSFEIKKDLTTTEVKNQASSGTCWSYATTSFVESEMARMGKEPVDLSEMFTVRMVYLDKAIKYVRLNGHLNFAQGGALPDVLYVIKKYGAVPEQAYHGLNYGEEINKHGELELVLKNFLDGVIANKNKRLSTAWLPAFNAILDSYLGVYPKEFEYKGKKYTPRSFADEVVGINPDEYVQLTSFSHDPYFTEVFIEVPDNWTWGTSYNVPLKDFRNALDFALDKGFTVDWAADVSEKGFSLKNGVAIVSEKDFLLMSDEERKEMFNGPKPEKVITEALRQLAYDNYETTDDHAMHITGFAFDKESNKYYLVKNSWGDRKNDYRDGYLFVSEPYFDYKTISILMHKDALSKDLKKKLKI